MSYYPPPEDEPFAVAMMIVVVGLVVLAGMSVLIAKGLELIFQ